MFATGIPPHVEVFRAIAASEGRQKAHVERVLDERGVNAGTVTDGRLSSVVAASESRTNEKLDEIKSLLVQQSGTGFYKIGRLSILRGRKFMWS